MQIHNAVRELLHAGKHARILQTRCEDVNWSHLAQDIDQWWALVSLRVP